MSEIEKRVGKLQSEKKSYEWYSFGDINAFFGLLLDNLAGLILTVSLLVGVFQMPADFVIGSMVPGTAIGVLVGDMLYSWLAFRLAARKGHSNVTAMPLGLDTPSIFGISMFVVGPSFSGATASGMTVEQASTIAWHIGICSMVYSGLFKLVCSFVGPMIRRFIPKAGLFGSLTSIALVIISFVPLIDILHAPLVGMIALAIVLTSLIGQVRLPFQMPGTVAALLVAGTLHYVTCWWTGQPMLAGGGIQSGFLPSGWLNVFGLGWMSQMGVAASYLPIVIPFALATVVGGLDCTESASAAGDDYSTMQVLGVEALATLVAGLCGGVIQTTPYIGHPAYKSMGGKAAYTMATALVVGVLGVFGGFHLFYTFVPKSIVFPILIFVGLEISSQSFQAIPKKHYPALVLACVPALAFLAYMFAGQILDGIGISLADGSIRPPLVQSFEALSSSATGNDEATKAVQVIRSKFELRPDLQNNLMILLLLQNGFVLTSLLWASFLAMAIDRRMFSAALVTAIAAVFTLFGLMHSPLPSNAIFTLFPIPGLADSWILDVSLQKHVWGMFSGYLGMTAVFATWGVYLRSTPEPKVPAVG